jgi:hypothetical protein
VGLRTSAVIFATAIAAAAGCNLHFPDATKIEDLRILDLHADPPEIAVFRRGGSDPLAFDPKSPPPIDLTPVKLTALVAHPDLGATFLYDWIRCGAAFDSVPCDPPERQPLVPDMNADLQPEVSVPIVLELFQGLMSGQDTLAALTATLAQDPRDLLNGLYAHVNLSVSVSTAAKAVDTARLEATKRVVIFDPRLVAFSIARARAMGPDALLKLGLPNLCTSVSNDALDKVLTFLKTRTPNRSPTFAGLDVAVIDPRNPPPRGTQTPTRALGAGEVLEVPPGAAVILHGRSNPDDAEAFQMIDANCALEKFTEELSFAWFTNSGSLSRPLTTKDNPTTEYDAPPAFELKEDRTRIRIWSVLRDGRGGSDSKTMDVVIDKSL